MTFFKKIRDFFKQRNSEEIKLLKGIDVDKIHENPLVSEEIRRTIKANNGELEELQYDKEDASKLISRINQIKDLPIDELTELETLATKYSQDMMRKNTFQELLNKQDEDTMYLEKFIDEIPHAIGRIEEYEKKQSAVKHDMHILEGEKGELAYRKNRDVVAYNFTKVFMIFMVVISAITALAFMTLVLFYNKNILIPGLIAIIVIFVLMLWISIFRRYLNHDVKKVQRLQNRAIELLNKTKIKYINNQSLLDYEYEKYRVNSSEILRLRLENYLINIENEKEYNSIESELITIKGAVNRLLLRNNIDKTNDIIEYIDYLSNQDSIEKMYLNKVNELEEINDKIQFCEKQNRVLKEILKEYES